MDEYLTEGNTDWFSADNMNEALNGEYEGGCPCCGTDNLRMLWDISSCRNRQCPIWIARVGWKKDSFPFLKPVVNIWFDKMNSGVNLTLPKDQKKAKEWALNVLEMERKSSN